jgi:hypothetical protein
LLGFVGFPQARPCSTVIVIVALSVLICFHRRGWETEHVDMAEPSARHEWINTCIAGVALLVAGAAAYFSWQANQMKKENLAILASSTDDCPFDILTGQDLPKVTLCWLVTLSNKSEVRLSIVGYQVVEVLRNNSTEEIPSYQHLETVDGKPLSLPINLDGGEAKQILVRAPTSVPSVVTAIAQMPEYKRYKSGSSSSLSLRKAGEILFAAGMDILGNRIPHKSGDKIRSRTMLLSMTTGRGVTFNQPPDL